MLNETAVMADLEEMERESRRKEYPADFPALPEIPVARYTDEAFFDLEMRYLWGRTWLFAGHVNELPEPGSYKLFDKLDQSIIVMRGKDGAIRAFHNTCRHRGAALLTEPSGRASRIVCPYHSWSYSSEGDLKVVPQEHNFACLDKSERGLLKVRCETWRGLVFINLDDNAGSLEAHLKPFSDRIGNFPLEEMEIKRSTSHVLECNWKAAYDNFIEIYHIPSVHGKTAMQWLKPETFIVTLLGNGHSSLTTERRLDLSEADQDEAAAQLLHGPLPDGVELVPGSDPFLDNHSIVAAVFPNLNFGGFNPAGFPLTAQWPVGLDKTVMETFVLGWKGTDTSSAFWDSLLADIMVQVDEDLSILANIQKALKAPGYGGPVLSYLERAIYWYNENVDEWIGSERIPANMRLIPALKSQVSY